MDCEHSWTEKTFPGLETRWCTRCNDTETEVELADLRAEVARLREVVRRVRGLAWSPTMEATRQIRELTKEEE